MLIADWLAEAKAIADLVPAFTADDRWAIELLAACVFADVTGLDRTGTSPAIHHLAVARYGATMAARAGWPRDEALPLVVFGLLHDVGGPAGGKLVSKAVGDLRQRDPQRAAALEVVRVAWRWTHQAVCTQTAVNRLLDANHLAGRPVFGVELINKLAFVIQIHDLLSCATVVPDVRDPLWVRCVESDMLWMSSRAGVESEVSRASGDPADVAELSRQVVHNLRTLRSRREKLQAGPVPVHFAGNSVFQLPAAQAIYEEHLAEWRAILGPDHWPTVAPLV